MKQSKYIVAFLNTLQKILFKIFKNDKIRALITTLTGYEVFTHLFFGVLTTLVDVVIYYILVFIGIDEVITNVISSTCAILFAYFTNSRWVFESHAETTKESLIELVKFFEARIATLLISTFIIWVFKMLHGNPYIAKLITMVLTIVLKYILSKVFVFTAKKKGNENNAKKN